MTINSKVGAEENSIQGDENFQGISGLKEELSHFMEFTSDDLFGKIEVMCREGLQYDNDEMKETMLYSILFTLETYFALHNSHQKRAGPKKMEFFF